MFAERREEPRQTPSPQLPQLWPAGPHRGKLVVLVVVVVLLVVVDGATGAHSNFGAVGVTERLPNWSFSWKAGKVSLGHLIL